MIVSVESSCDESAIAVFDQNQGILGEWVHTQIQTHQQYGGVVPDIASREHLKNFPYLLKPLTGCLDGKRPDKIVVTNGPGLAGCLALGMSVAKALALAWDLPVYGVNHLRGHALSPFMSLHESAPLSFTEKFKQALPHLGLIVSGGNTILFEIGDDFSWKILAQTVDDAAGEALDKGAKLLGMPYPGGPLIEKKAQGGNVKHIDFPRAYYNKPDMKFSFSGLKTSLRYLLEDLDDEQLLRDEVDICASYQEAVMDALAKKTKQALKRKNYKSLGLSGGVSNNKRLQAVFKEIEQSSAIPLYMAKPKHTGDNAAMIAFAAWLDPKSLIKEENNLLAFNPSLTLV